MLVLRDETERPEAVAAGTARLFGSHLESIVAAVEALCDRPEIYTRFTRAVSPYGDGRSSERIARIPAERFGLDPGPLPTGFTPTWEPAV